MYGDADRRLSPLEAARIIYGTERPTPQQVERVRSRIRLGFLARSPQRSGSCPSTTAGAVAEYLAGQTYLREREAAESKAAGRVAAGAGTPGPGQRRMRGAMHPPSSRGSELVGAYHTILRDYFQALVLRRHRRRASRRFRRAVLAGQIASLLLLIAAVVLSVRPLFVEAVLTPERAAVVEWLESESPQHKILRWFPAEPDPEGAGLWVRVQYRYVTPRGDTVHTDRRFLVQHGRVGSVESDW